MNGQGGPRAQDCGLDRRGVGVQLGSCSHGRVHQGQTGAKGSLGVAGWSGGAGWVDESMKDHVGSGMRPGASGVKEAVGFSGVEGSMTGRAGGLWGETW